MNLIEIVSLFLIILAVIFFFISVKTTSATHGKKIDDYQNSKTALLVIDMQNDSIGPSAKNPFPPVYADKLIENVNKVIDIAKNNGWIIVYIKQELPKNQAFVAHGKFLQGSKGAEIDKRIKIESNNFFTKKYSDSFSNPEFDKFLRKNYVDKIYITGVAADECVRATAFGAQNRGYEVIAVKEAIGTPEQQDLDKILETYTKRGI